MKNFLIGLACLCFTLGMQLQAQTENKYTGSLLWKVSGKDITQPSYILGTHHMTDVTFLDKINGFKESFDASNVVIGELDLSNKAELMQLIQASAMISEGEKGYKDLLTEEQLEKLNTDLIANLGIPLEPLMVAKPSMISILLAAKMYSNVKPNFNPQTHKAIDEYVQIWAQEQNKTVKGLETANDQLAALFSSSIQEQLDDLICDLSEIDLSIESLKEMEALYEAGNLNGLHTLAFEEDGESKCPMKKEKKYAILDNRNEQWMQQLPQLLKDDSNFIAVGALHLAGEEGLLYQLAKMGYTVEAVQ